MALVVTFSPAYALLWVACGCVSFKMARKRNSNTLRLHYRLAHVGQCTHPGTLRSATLVANTLTPLCTLNLALHLQPCSTSTSTSSNRDHGRGLPSTTRSMEVPVRVSHRH